MEEKIYTAKKNGMVVLLGYIVLFFAAIVGTVCGGILSENEGRNTS